MGSGVYSTIHIVFKLLSSQLYTEVTRAFTLHFIPAAKKKHQSQQDEEWSYIKKPPNAFMLYLTEQRSKVMAQLNITRSAAVNAVVGASVSV